MALQGGRGALQPRPNPPPAGYPRAGRGGGEDDGRQRGASARPRPRAANLRLELPVFEVLVCINTVIISATYKCLLLPREPS